MKFVHTKKVPTDIDSAIASNASMMMPSLNHLKDKVLRIILLQGQGRKNNEGAKEKLHGDKLRNILEEVDQVAKAIFMTGVPKQEGHSPTHATDTRKKQLETER